MALSGNIRTYLPQTHSYFSSSHINGFPGNIRPYFSTTPSILAHCDRYLVKIVFFHAPHKGRLENGSQNQSIPIAIGRLRSELVLAHFIR